MNPEIDTSNPPTAKELKGLFLQTSWAAERKLPDIEVLLRNTQVFVAVREHQVLVGFGRALTDGIYRALIDDIVVHQAYRNQGLGKRIVDTLVHELHGVEEIFLNTTRELVKFYEGSGFSKADGITMKNT